jgi:hypothetical protein
MKTIIILSAAALLASCNQASDANGGSNNQAAATPAPKNKPPYCFFKDVETKAWSASVGAGGNIVVTGEAYRSDPRYKAVLVQPKVEGKIAEVWPTIVVNDTGYAAPDNWWAVKLTIPGSAAADTVRIRCGAKVLVELKVPRSS